MRGFKLLLHKAYFDKGFGITNYAKYILILFGWATNNVNLTIAIGFVYVIACYIVGRLWYRYKLTETEKEIENIFNPFVQEVRSKL